MNSEDLITTKEVAEISGYNVSYITQLVRKNKLKPEKVVDNKGSMVFKRSDITAFFTSYQGFNRKPPLNTDTVAEIVSRVKNGETISAVAKEFKINTNEVYKHVLKSYKK